MRHFAAHPDRRAPVAPFTGALCAALLVVNFGCDTGGTAGPDPDPDPVVTEVTVALPVDSLLEGGSAQAEASAWDQDGAPMSATFTWSALNTAVATVTQTGLVSGVAEGTTDITATAGGVTGSTAVRVVAEAAPPAGAECDTPAAEWIWCDDFEADRSASYFEYISEGGALARVAATGVDGSTGLRAHFVAGAQSAGNLHLAFGATPDTYFKPVDAGTANYREIYWRLYLRNQAGWTGGGGDKLSRVMILAAPSWAQAMIAHVWSGSSASTQDYLLIDPASGTDAQGQLKTTKYNDFDNFRWLGSASSSTALFAGAEIGQWHCIEAHVRLNDAGSSNGVFNLWIDGIQEPSRTGLNFVGDFNAYGMNALFVENYWNAGSPVAQDRFLDNLVVSTAPIGCL